MSEAYYHLNPYQYTTNNPVKFIDINGDYIYIYDNGTKYRYDNGQLYSKNEETGKFDVEYTASEGSYASQILGMLNQIGCEDCKGGKAFLNLFNNDDFNVGIRNNTYNGRYKGKNVTRQNGKSMEVMTFFNQNENIATTSGFESLTKNMFATIGHELGHALSDFIFDNKVTDATWYSMTNDRGTTSNIKNDEVYAMFIENMIRRENNIPQRTHYTLTGEGSVMEESRMMKKVNKTWMIDDKAYSILQKIQQTQKK